MSGPDWATAPRWAKYWAVDRHGPCWYARKPKWTEAGWDPSYGNFWIAPRMENEKPGTIVERPGGA